MKNGKARGADGISADLLQAEKSLTFTILSNFFCEVWISENMLEDWSTGLIVRLKKQGDPSPCIKLHLGKRARGRPRETWRRSVEEKMWGNGIS